MDIGQDPGEWERRKHAAERALEKEERDADE